MRCFCVVQKQKGVADAVIEAPDDTCGHELSRPKRVSWLPAYGVMSGTSIPVSCVGVKTHVFMNDLVW